MKNNKVYKPYPMMMGNENGKNVANKNQVNMPAKVLNVGVDILR